MAHRAHENDDSDEDNEVVPESPRDVHPHPKQRRVSMSPNRVHQLRDEDHNPAIRETAAERDVNLNQGLLACDDLSLNGMPRVRSYSAGEVAFSNIRRRSPSVGGSPLVRQKETPPGIMNSVNGATQRPSTRDQRKYSPYSLPSMNRPDSQRRSISPSVLTYGSGASMDFSVASPSAAGSFSQPSSPMRRGESRSLSADTSVHFNALLIPTPFPPLAGASFNLPARKPSSDGHLC
eukprot:m.34858 g.34858  ORF g.34858 m.34858 type:complete len:235 (+) comp5272_c0_seq1:136-840(+)